MSTTGYLIFFRDHAHCTKFAGTISAFANIYAIVIQGSAIGPASHIVTAADLHPVYKANQIFKLAEDTYLVVPAARKDTCQKKINHLQTWAVEHNLKLNRDKTKEIVFTSSRNRMPPPPCLGIKRVTSLRILGVIVNDRMMAADNVTMLLSSCSSLLYAMRVLRAHGIPATSLRDIFRATVVSRIQNAAPAWSGRCSSADCGRRDSILRRSKRLGYSNNDLSSIADLFNSTDDDFFNRIKINSSHVLQPYLPDKLNLPYQLRTRSHNKTLINKAKLLNSSDLIVRMLHKYSP